MTIFVLPVFLPMLIASVTPRDIAKTAKEVTVRVENIKDNSQNGSGLIVGKQRRDYLVLTVSNLVGGDRRNYVIYTTDENKHSITSMETLPMNLALLKFASPIDYETAPIAQGVAVSNGQRIYVSGFPFPTGQTKQEYRFTDGKITNTLPNQDRGYDLLYEAPTGNGMLGSPIFNEQGQVIGIHTVSSIHVGVRLDGTARVKVVTNGAIAIKAFLDWQAGKK